MLRGPTKITLDAKGRLSIPTRFREQLAARCGGQLICTVDPRGCVAIFPLPDWEEAERKLLRMPSLDETAQELQDHLLDYATELEPDGHHRVLIPKEHREFAGLDRQAMLFGRGNKFHLWDEDRWNERMKSRKDKPAAREVSEEVRTLWY